METKTGKQIIIQNTIEWFYSILEPDIFDKIMNSGELIEMENGLKYIIIAE